MLNIPKLIWFGANLFVVFWWIIPVLSGPIYSKCVRYHVCARYIKSSGWPFYYSVDLADNQWRDIRGNLPLLWACLLGISGLHFLVIRYYKKFNTSSITASKSCWFRFIVGVIFLYVLHQWHMYIILIISLIAYQLAMYWSGCKWARLYTWLFALVILMIKESYRIKHYLNSDVSLYGAMYAVIIVLMFIIL